MSKKKGEHGHHGGAWKVAYADFVTAMMALFIVLWILGSSEETKAAVSSYFRNPSVFSHGGRGFLTEDGYEELQKSMEEIRKKENSENSETEAPPSPVGEMRAAPSPETSDRDEEGLKASAKMLEGLLNSSEMLRQMRAQVSIEFTSQGLRVLLHDVNARPLFSVGSPNLEPGTEALLRVVARVLKDLPNQILIEGHTDARPYSGERVYSNWELSSDRANAARRILESEGIAPSRIAQVVGYADRHPLLPDDPLNEQNRRISIIVCYRDSLGD